MKIFISLNICLFSILTLCSQGENNHWITQGYAIDFGTGFPTLRDQTGIARITPSSTVSDRQGNLLFYSDGIQVMNRDFDFMPGGLFLKGTSFADKTALFIPNPIDSNLYYLFTLNLRDREIQYSVIDRRLDNGLGDIVEGQKNIPFATNVASLMLSAKGVCGSIWLIIAEENSNQILSYEIDSDGIAASPIISDVSQESQLFTQTFPSRDLGLFSPDSKKLAIFNRLSSQIHLFDFDRNTGQFSNQINLPFPVGYGLSGGFSSDGSKLYVNQRDESIVPNPNQNPPPTHIFQFDLSANNRQQIIDSQTLIATKENTYQAFFQLSRDNSLYISDGNTHLSQIRFPNLLGTACGFMDSVLVFPNTTVNNHKAQNWVFSADLPSQKDSMFLPTDLNFCTSNELLLNLEGMGETFQWQDGTTSPTYTITEEGKYWVEISKGNCIFRDTMEAFSMPSSLDLGPDTTLCSNETLEITLTNLNANYTWQDGNNTSSISIETAGEYWVEIQEGNCITNDSITVNYHEFSINLGQDTTFCEPTEVNLDATTIDANYLWQNGSDNATFITQEAGLFWVEVTQNNCTETDSIFINFESLSVDLGADTTICDGTSLLLSTNNLSSQRIKWSDGSVDRHLLVEEGGIYEATISTQNCQTKDSIIVSTKTCLPDICNLYIPNTFSPNNDGENDFFQVYSGCETINFELEIYDRWGNRLFKTTDIQQHWDGKTNGQILENGVYLVKIDYQIEQQNKQETKVETLTILK